MISERADRRVDSRVGSLGRDHEVFADSHTRRVGEPHELGVQQTWTFSHALSSATNSRTRAIAPWYLIRFMAKMRRLDRTATAASNRSDRRNWPIRRSGTSLVEYVAATSYSRLPMDAAELRQRAVHLEADLWPDHAEERRGAAELLAGLADYDAALLRRALLGEAGSGSAGRDLLADAIECAEDESGG
jgi:hypothetical protein